MPLERMVGGGWDMPKEKVPAAGPQYPLGGNFQGVTSGWRHVLAVGADGDTSSTLLQGHHEVQDCCG